MLGLDVDLPDQLKVILPESIELRKRGRNKWLRDVGTGYYSLDSRWNAGGFVEGLFNELAEVVPSNAVIHKPKRPRHTRPQELEVNINFTTMIIIFGIIIHGLACRKNAGCSKCQNGA